MPARGGSAPRNMLLPLALLAHSSPSPLPISPASRGAGLTRCAENATHPPHFTDVLASKRHRFFFVDNVKSGSSTIRKSVNEILGFSWNTRQPIGHRHAHDRYNSGNFLSSEVRHLFVFSIVRDPVAKFESGVRQAMAEDPSLRRYTADQILSSQIAAYDGRYKGAVAVVGRR